MATKSIPALQVFKDLMVSLVGFDPVADAAMLNDLYTASKPYYAQNISVEMIPSVLATSPTAPASYKQYLGQFENVRKVNPEITSLSEFVTARQQYKTIMSRYGLTELATNDSADNFMANRVSPSEAVDRLNLAFDAVTNADSALRKQLQTYYPNLDTKSVVKTILGVGKTVTELQREISIAGIKAEAETAGLSSAIGAEELSASGVTREQARAGFQKTAQELQPTMAAASRAGVDAAGLQKELESENLLGLASKRRKRIQTAEAARFSGSSGTMQGSFKKRAQGAI